MRGARVLAVLALTAVSAASCKDDSGAGTFVSGTGGQAGASAGSAGAGGGAGATAGSAGAAGGAAGAGGPTGTGGSSDGGNADGAAAFSCGSGLTCSRGVEYCFSEEWNGAFKVGPECRPLPSGCSTCSCAKPDAETVTLMCKSGAFTCVGDNQTIDDQTSTTALGVYCQVP